MDILIILLVLGFIGFVGFKMLQKKKNRPSSGYTGGSNSGSGSTGGSNSGSGSTGGFQGPKDWQDFDDSDIPHPYKGVKGPPRRPEKVEFDDRQEM
jgi:hypothetical protein